MIFIFFQQLKQEDISYSLLIALINFVTLTGSLFDSNFVVIALSINFIQFLISFKQKKENAIDFNILSFFSSLILLGMCFDVQNYLNLIIICILLVAFIFYSFYRSSKIANKINNKINLFFYQWINQIIIGFILIAIFLSITFFITRREFNFFYQPWFINSELNLDSTFLLGNEIKNLNTQKIVFNACFWLVNIFILIYIIKNNSIFNFRRARFFNFSNVDFSILFIFIFWNPISLNLFSYIYDTNLIYIKPNFQILFIPLITSFIFSIAQKNLDANIKWYKNIQNIFFPFLSIACILGVNFFNYA